MGIKTIANVRSGSHRYLAVKAMIDGHAAGKSHEEICADIFTAVSNNGGVISPKSAYGWYANLQGMIKNEDGTDICPLPPAKTAKVKAPKEGPVETVTAAEPAPVDTQEMLSQIHDAVVEGMEDTEVDLASVAKLDEELRASE